MAIQAQSAIDPLCGMIDNSDFSRVCYPSNQRQLSIDEALIEIFRSQKRRRGSLAGLKGLSVSRRFSGTCNEYIL